MMTNCRVLMCLLAVMSAVLRNSHCQYQQIDLKTISATCNMSSVYQSSKHGDSLGCVGAIDGDTDTEWRPTRDPKPNCIFTEIDLYAYWFLNLQQEHNIHKITIYYEKEYTEYMRNVRVTADGNEIFRYPESLLSINNPKHITNNLPVKARIIKIERTIEHSKNYLPLCEVQLWECETNRYGNHCAKTCSLNCQDNRGRRTCDTISGKCFNGCKSSTGKFNSSCTGCEDGWYGDKCDVQCPHNCAGACDHRNGTCFGCQVGYLGPNCSETCSKNCNGGCGQYDRRCNNCRAGHWGDECNMACNRGCQNNNCSRDNGQCTCKPEWQLPDCDVCDTSQYSLDCGETCGHCTGEARCHNVTGHCPSCMPGWTPPFCKEECSERTYGQNCSSPCGHCTDDGVCDTVTGRCPAGCGPGYRGYLCEEEPSISGNITGPIVGGLLGAGALIGLSAMLSAIIIRRRRPPQPPSGDNIGDLPMNDSRPHQTEKMTDEIPADSLTAENVYDPVDTYVNPDAMKVYTALKTTAGSGPLKTSGGKMLAAAGNDEVETDAAVYQNVPMHQ